MFVLGIASPIFAQLDSKQLVGNWKYSVVTDQGEMTGVFKFTENEGKLKGEIITAEGYNIPMSKIEIKEENNLYLEIQTDSDLIKVKVKVDGKNFKGTGSSYQGEAPITGEKQE
ncbi:MAG: hypothetical protein FD181_1942 [Prolixibacteraceae bacterium]|nr:MAG: hypothetical protein FD181_1942 [Prolixibacteraceae bacterium]